MSTSSSTRRTVGSTGGIYTNGVNVERSTPTSSYKEADINENWPDGFGDFTGESNEERNSYYNVYKLVKDFPEWLALLDANPYKGFDIPTSIFDDLGLSNKAKDKMNALRQEYMNYNASILAKFMEWKNSLPATQREQLNEAGYSSDLAQVSPSSLSSDIPQGSAALQMPSGNSAEDLINIVGSAASLFSTGASVALGFMSTLSNISLQEAQKNNIGKIGEGLDLGNFNSSLDTAKRIYSNLAPHLEKPKDPNEIMASFSLQYPDAPESVNKALQNYVNSREFQEGLIESETKILDSESAFNQSFMTNEDLKLLVGSPDYWLGIRKLANEVYMNQLKEINEYLDTLDTVTQVRASNQYATYMQQYFAELNRLGVPGLSAETAVSQNNAAIASFEMQKSYAERNRSVLESQNQRMQEYFKVLESDDKSGWSKFWAASFMLSNSWLTRWTDPSSTNNGGSAPFSPVGLSSPSLPSFSLPNFK